MAISLLSAEIICDISCHGKKIRGPPTSSRTCGSTRRPSRFHAAGWGSDVSGKQVVRQWFSYRKNDRKRPQIGDRRPPSELEGTRPEGWVVDYDRDLIDLLHVLTRVVSKEAAQADLLERICLAPTFGEDELLSAKAIVPRTKAPGKSARSKNKDQMEFLP